MITCVYVAPSCPSHLHERQGGMQLAMESKEQQLRAQSSFEEGLRTKLSAGSPSFLGEQAVPVSQS